MTAKNKQKIAVFDIDGTIFRSSLYREIIFELIATNKIPKEMSNIFADHQLEWQMRKSAEAFTEFDNKVVETFLAGLKYMNIDDYKAAAKKVITTKGHFCYYYTKKLARKLKEQGYYLIIISGSFNDVVQDFVKIHNFDLGFGTIYEEGQDKFTGKILREGWHNKEQILQQNLDWNKFTLEDSYAVGDTMGDASLLNLVDHPIAFNPQDQLLKLAKTNHWDIIVERKNSVYKLRYKDGEYRLK